MHERRDTYVPRKHQADYKDRGNWYTTETRNIHRVVYCFKQLYDTIYLRIFFYSGLQKQCNPLTNLYLFSLTAQVSYYVIVGSKNSGDWRALSFSPI